MADPLGPCRMTRHWTAGAGDLQCCGGHCWPRAWSARANRPGGRRPLALRDHVIAPILAGIRSPRMVRKPTIWTAIYRDHKTLRIDMQALFRHVGIETQPAAA